jgi:hypothetical protein
MYQRVAGSMWLKWHKRIIKYWFKLLATENCILFHISIYENSVRCNENKYWGNTVKELLCKYGFQEVWLYPHSVDVNICLPICKQRVKDCYLQEWNSDVNSMQPLLTYRAIKVNHCYEDYLNSITCIKYRKALTRFRLSSHNLKIEYGRHGCNRIYRQLRVCIYCDKHDIEDEYHFTLVCTLYNELRKKHISSYYLKILVCLSAYNK